MDSQESDFIKNKVYEEYNLGEICKVVNGVVIKNQFIKEPPIGKPVLKSTNIKNGQLNLENIKFYDYTNNKTIKKGELIMSAKGKCGKVAINKTDTVFLFSNSLFKLEPDETILSKSYLYYFLKNSNLKSIVYGYAGEHMTVEDVKTLKIKVPSLQEQLEISKKMILSEQLTTVLEQELELRNRQIEYFDSKIQRERERERDRKKYKLAKNKISELKKLIDKEIKIREDQFYYYWQKFLISLKNF